MNTTASPVLSFQELLVATDLSHASEKAVGYAKAIARRYGSHILLAHVSQSFERIPIPQGGWVEDDTHRQIGLQMEAQGVALRSEGLRVEALNLYGPTQHEIQFLADTRHSDLLILGTHGRQGLARLVIGSEAESIIRNAKCPVLTVGPAAPPAPSGPWRPRDILCGISLDSDSVRTAVFAYMLALNMGASFCLFHIENDDNPPNAAAWEVFDKAFESALPEGIFKSWPIRSYLSNEPVGTSLAGIANKLKSDLIILGAGNSTYLGSHFGQGVLPSVFLEAQCPVLTVNPASE